jgi:hypothetical protein
MWPTLDALYQRYKGRGLARNWSLSTWIWIDSGLRLVLRSEMVRRSALPWTNVRYDGGSEYG